MNDCNYTIKYKKSNPSEIIQIGDVIMLDPESLSITKAYIENDDDYNINSRLIVGVCIDTDNASKIPKVLSGGSSKDTNINEIDGGDSTSIERILVESGKSGQNSREIITVAYAGQCLVNICGYVDLGDKLCISTHPGKAKSKDLLDSQYFSSRSIGKVVKFTNNKEQVKALLDIE